MKISTCGWHYIFNDYPNHLDLNGGYCSGNFTQESPSSRGERLKHHPHGSVLFVTFSLEESLLLLANHVHLVLVVDNQSDIAGVIKYFKTESAHMLTESPV